MRGHRVTVDMVALVLAVALALAVTLLMSVVLVNVIEHQTPTQTLGENATQVIIAIIGGLIGVLGSYIGARVIQRNGKTEPKDLLLALLTPHSIE
jgi:Mn2+/Fe2+ NRAMP family transporter